MTFIKIGEALTVQSSDFRSYESLSSDSDILERFTKFAHELKAIAPKADDFLYFSAIMITAAEACCLNEDGSVKKDSYGNDVVVGWDKKGDSWRWKSSDPNLKAYKNNNGDIFPETELLSAYKKWVGKPLCLDHKSSSVDMVRGLIVDTYYDTKHKRVIALCALDKKNYPDLARKVSTGYTTSVSMGTGVERAVCYDCGQVAKYEADFCNHMKTRSCYGEINLGLNPIELSIVVNGADPKAKIRRVIAAADSIAKYVESKEKFAQENLDHDLTELKHDVEELKKEEEKEVEQQNSTLDLLNKINEKLETISDKISKLEENEMTVKKGYFQGGGGVNEPTPGQVKYEKEDSDSIRDKEDKQMTTPTNLGPVDGMVPGDAEVKKQLQRMAEEQEMRQMRRQAALEKAKKDLAKKAYHQGGSKGVEPDTYKSEDSDSIRDKEDKQMTGQAPFPGVGDVEGLHPSPASVKEKDELKRKQMLSRAKLNAKFVKAANSDGTDNLKNSRWNVFANNKLVLSATVDEITGGRAELLYGSVATEDFGRNLLNKVRNEGVESVASKITVAQEMPAAPETPAAPPPAMPAPEAAPVANEAPVADVGGSGDPSEQLPGLLDEAEGVLSDIRKGVEALSNESDSELKEFENMGDQLSPTTASLFPMRAKLARALTAGMKQASEELESCVDELKVASEIYSNKEKYNEVELNHINQLTSDSVSETKEAVANCFKLMKSFCKYAQGTDSLVKQASKEIGLKKSAQATQPGKPLEQGSGAYADLKPEELGMDGKKPAQVVAPKPDAQKVDDVPSGIKTDMNKAEDEACADDCMAHDHMSDSNDLKMNTDGTLEGSPEEVGKAMKASQASVDLSTKEARAAYRLKMAEKGSMFSSVLTDAHGKTGPKVTNDKGDLSKVETLEEQHKAMMDLALAPPRIKKMAEDIQKLVVAGKIDPVNDFPGLMAQGLDKDAVAYWKKFWGDVKDGGSEFANELIKEHVQKKASEEKEAYKVKISRAYELTYEMVRKGMLSDDRSAVNQQVNELMSFDDKGFESMKRYIERQASVKTASMPQVGLMSHSEILGSEPVSSDLKDQLAEIFNAPKRRY